MRKRFQLYLIAFGASFLSIFLCFQIALEYSLGSDSWFFLVHPERLVYQHSLTARPALAAMQWLFNRAHVNIIAVQFWDGLFGMILLAITMVMLQRALLAGRPALLRSQLLAFFISFALVSNPLMTEWFGNSFIIPGCCLAELLCVWAAILLAQDRLTWRKVLAIFALSLVACNLFQSPMSLIVPIAVALLALNDADLPKILRRFAIGMAAWAVGGLSGVIHAKYIHPLLFHGALDRRVSAFQPLANLKVVLSESKDIWIDCFTFIPKYVFVAVLAAALLLVLTLRVSRKLKLLTIASAALLIALTLGIHLVAGAVWMVPRSVTSLCAPIGILLVPALWRITGRIAFPAAIILGVFWFAICAMASTRVLSDHYVNYEMDSFEAKLIYQQITRYEQQTGTRVDKLAFKLDKYPWWCYDAVRCSGDFNVRSWSKWFPREPMIRIVSGRHFTEVPFTQSLMEIFGTDNWNEFSPDQVKCIGNTAYVGIY